MPRGQKTNTNNEGKEISKKGSKSFSCEKCNYCTERKSNLHRHELTMHKELEIKRQCCGVVFSTKSDMQNHQNIEHKNGYKCESIQCFMVFKTKALVERHHKCHSNNKKFKCYECPYACHYKSNLKRHCENKHDCSQLAEMNRIRRKRKSSTATPTSTLPSTPAETPPESPTLKREPKEATWSFPLVTRPYSTAVCNLDPDAPLDLSIRRANRKSDEEIERLQIAQTLVALSTKVPPIKPIPVRFTRWIC